MELFSNSSNTDGTNEARRILAVALKEASLVPDVYVSTVDFEIAHGNNGKIVLFCITVSVFFTTLQYAGDLSDRKRVRLSVHLSVCHSVNCDKTNTNGCWTTPPYMEILFVT